MKISPKFLFGVAVVVIGVILLFEQAGIFPLFSKYFWLIFSKFWPLILIFLGAKLLISKNHVPGIALFLLGVVFAFLKCPISALVLCFSFLSSNPSCTAK